MDFKVASTVKSKEDAMTEPKPPVEGEIVDKQPAEKSATAQEHKPNSVSVRDTKATSFLDPEVYVQMKVMANDFVQSKAIPKGWETPQQVLVAIQTGYEMGMKPMESLMSLCSVNGAINVWGKATVRRLTEHGWTISYSDESELGVTATIKRKDPKTGRWTIYSDHFSFKDAEQSGYVADSYGKLKIGWKLGANRRLKMRYNCLALIIKTYVPEVLGAAAGIVEVEQDGQATPTISQADLISGAERKRKALTAQNFKPKPVANQTAPE